MKTQYSHLSYEKFIDSVKYKLTTELEIELFERLLNTGNFQDQSDKIKLLENEIILLQNAYVDMKNKYYAATYYFY
jgi:hypothetical protein